MTAEPIHRRFVSRFLARAALLLAVVCPAAAWAVEPGERVGVVVRVQGEVAAVPAGVAPRPLAADVEIRFGEDVVTGGESRLLMRLRDGTEITLGENARLTVDDFVYDPAQGRAGATVRVATGAFAVATGGIAKLRPQDMVFKTPVATIGIRGTEFWGGPIDEVYGVLLKAGRVEVRNDAGAVELAPGQGTTLTSATATPSAPVTWSEVRKAKAAASVAFR